VTAVSLLLISFPSYSTILFQNKNVATVSYSQEKIKKITLAVKGMTCTTCEHHIENEVTRLSGVRSVKASYENNSATVEYNPEKVSHDKIIASINSTGYIVDQKAVFAQEKTKWNCCSKGSSCTAPLVKVPQEKSKTLQTLSSVDQIKNAFNKQPGKVRFIAVLSSTCGWCLQGAKAVQKSVIEKMVDKNIGVIILWTNMLKTDDKENAYMAASMFKNPNIVQFYDAENKFGDIVARSLNPKGEKAWDIYLFYDRETEWQKSLPRPFDYAHQLSPTNQWVDNTKYFCGTDLLKRLDDITNSL
jgi:copper chaperone CopZ